MLTCIVYYDNTKVFTPKEVQCVKWRKMNCWWDLFTL